MHLARIPPSSEASQRRRFGRARRAALIGFGSGLLLASCSRPALPPPAPVPAPPPSSAPAALPPAEGAASEPSAAPAASGSPEPAPPAPPASAAEATDAGAAAAPHEERGPHGQTPVDMITARDAAFLINYTSSDAQQRAETECERQAKGDLGARGACMTAARDRFLPDVVRFRAEGQDRFTLLVYKRSGSTLRELYSGAIELKEQANDAVRLRFTGREKGQRPFLRSVQETVVSVPNNYNIELSDAELGKLVYDEKIGLVSQ